MLFGLLVFGALVLLVLWLATTYNSLVVTAERTTSAWHELETLLTQRHDELPKLIDFCEPHLQGARTDFERALAARSAVVDARQKRDAMALNHAEGALRRELGALLARAAASPELGPSPAFGLLRQRHATLDTEIDQRRVLYNQAVAEHNATLRRPLGSVVALLGGFRALRALDGDTTADAP